MTTPTRARDAATRAAARGEPEALDLARAVDDPWFRCQALAWVARYAEEDQVEPIARESLVSARQERQAYRTVAVRAWPIAAVTERGLTDLGGRWAEDAGHESRRIEHPVSRLDALYHVVQAGWSTPSRPKLTEWLRRAARDAASWRSGRIQAHLIGMLLPDQRDLSLEVLEEMAAGQYKRQASRILTAGTHLPPRPFFWRD